MADDRQSRLRRLTPKQTGALNLLCRRYTYTEMAEQLGISKSGVQARLEAVFIKLGLRDLDDDQAVERELESFCVIVRGEQPSAVVPAEESGAENEEDDPELAAATSQERARVQALVLRHEPPSPIRVQAREIQPWQTEPPQPPAILTRTGLPWLPVAGIAVGAALLGAVITKILFMPSTAPAPIIQQVVVTATTVSADTPQATTAAAAVPTSQPTLTRTAVPIPTSTVIPPTSTATIAPVRAPAGTVLYQADWSNGMNGWVGAGQWKVVSGMLVNDGTQSGMINAPYNPPTADYATEAEVQFLTKDLPYGSMMLAFRGDQSGNYRAGWSDFAARICLPGGGSCLVSKAFEPGTDWHVYRAVAHGNQLRLLVDGNPILEAFDNRYLTGTSVGLFGSGVQFNVRAYRVIAQ